MIGSHGKLVQQGGRKSFHQSSSGIDSFQVEPEKTLEKINKQYRNWSKKLVFNSMIWKEVLDFVNQ